MDKKQVTEIEKKISDEIGIPPEYVILHVQSSKIKLYERLGEEEFLNDEMLLIKKENGDIVTLDQVSPFGLKQKIIRKLFIFCPEEYREKVMEVVPFILGLK